MRDMIAMQLLAGRGRQYAGATAEAWLQRARASVLLGFWRYGGKNQFDVEREKRIPGLQRAFEADSRKIPSR